MKIVHVTLRFDAPGGVESTVHEVTRRLRASGDHVEVFASDLVEEAGWVRGDRFRPEVDGVPVRRFRALRRPFPAIGPARSLSLPVMVGLVDALETSDAEVIHAHSHRYGHVLQAAVVARRRHRPFVVSTHYHPADRRESGAKRGLLRLEDVGFGMSAYRIADALVVETEREAALVREFAPSDRIRVIPPGIDLAAWSAPSEVGPIPPLVPADYFLFVGRLATNKGLPGLVEALARLPAPARRPLVLMGSDWGALHEIRGLAQRRGIAGSILPIGHIADPATYRAIVRGATAIVLPSEWEAFGLVLVEGMAAGVPVIATAVGGVPEVLDGGRAGRLVPYGDPEALAAALRATTEDPEGTRRRVDAGRTQASKFDADRTAARHQELYRELVRA